MKFGTRTSEFVRLVRLLLTLLTAIASVSACIQSPVLRHEVPVPYQMPSQLPPGVERLPISVGIYYSPEFEEYEHYDRYMGESGTATPVGRFSVRQFDSMLYAMFEHTQLVNHRPPYAMSDPASGLQIIIEPRIEHFNLNTATFSMGAKTARVGYRFKLYFPDGTTLANWEIAASDTGEWGFTTHPVDFSGARAEGVVRKSSIQFMQKFFDAPEVETWLAEISEQKAGAGQMAKSPDLAFDVNTSALASSAAPGIANTTLDGVEVSAKLYWQVGLTQVPIENLSVKVPVLTTRLTIKNNRAEPVVFDPSNLRLRTNRFATLTPDSAESVAQRMYREGEYGEESVAAEIFAGGIIGTLAAMNEANVNDEMIKRTTDALRREQLEDQTIAPNQTVSGVAYFIALGMDGELDSPRLRVGIADPSRRENYETSLNMASGAATVSTLLLTGSKQPEGVVSDVDEFTATLAALKLSLERGELSDEEYMQKQRAVVNEYTGNTRAGFGGEAAPSSGKHLRVALLPCARLPNYYCSPFYNFVHAYVDTHQNMDLVFSEYDTRFERGLAGTEEEIWKGNLMQKSPNKPGIVRGATRVDADVAVLFSGRKRLAGWGTDDFAFSIYVMDVETNRIHTIQGTELNYEKVIEDALEGVLRRRPQMHPTGTATGGTLLLAGLKPPESVTEKAEKIEAPQQAVATADTVMKSLRVGMLPPAIGGSSRSDEIEGEIYKEIRQYIASSRSFDLSFDYTRQYGPGSLDIHAVWQGTIVRKIPDEAKLRVIGEELGADILVLTTASGVTSYGGRIEIRMYVFDVASGKMYQGTDNFEQVKGLVASTFGPIERHQARQRDGGNPATGGPLRVGLLPPAFLNSTLPSSGEKELGIYSEIRRYIQSKPNVDLSYDYSARRGVGPSDAHAIWQGSGITKVPDKAKMKMIGEELGVDILALAWVGGGKGAGTTIDLYVLEVASGRMSHETENLGRAKGLVASTFAFVTVPTGGSRSPVAATVPAAATVAVQAQSRRQLLNPTELRVLLTRNTYTGQTKTGTKFHVYYRADGTMYGRLLSGRSKGKQDDGTWNVTDERGYCSRWAQWDGATELCFNVFRYGESVIFEQNSGYESRKSAGVMQSGNPENL